MPSLAMVSVHSGVAWPSEETRFTFGGHDLRLVPPLTDGASGSMATFPLAVAEAGDRNSAYARVTEIRRFLNALAWREQSFLREVDVSVGGWAMRVSTSVPSLTAGVSFDFTDLFAAPSPEAARALAFYREGLSLTHTAYRFLSFFKVLNVTMASGPQQKAWIGSQLSHLQGHGARERIAQLQANVADVGDYLYTSGRCAVAHAFSSPLVDPDDPDDDRRLIVDMPVMRELAAILLIRELGAPLPRRAYAD